MSFTAAQELYDPLYHTPQDGLYEIYRLLRDEHPVYRCERRDVWCISRHDDVQAAARDWATFSSAHGVNLELPPGFFGAGDFLSEDPPRHDVLRKAVRPFFVPKEIAKLERQIAGRVEALTARLASEERIDIAQEFAWALPIWVICRLLGVPTADDEIVHELVTDLETRQPGDGDAAELALPALRRLHAYTEDLAEHKRRSPADDLMSRLVAGEAEGAPRREEICGLTALLFTAGSETTAALIGNTLSLLAERRDVQQRLHDAPELIEAVIEESLRTETPVQYLARHTTAPASVGGVEIPPDSDVVLIFGAANRDERRFERAETFDVDRPAQRHLAFGEGIHFCLGAPLARLEARLAVPAFLRAMPSYEIDRPASERFFNHTVRGFMHLPATIR